MATPFWPDVSTMPSASSATKAGAVGAFIVAALTGILAATGFGGIGRAAFLDAFAFLILGLFMLRHSRIAAVLALTLFVAEKLMQFAAQPGSMVGIGIAAIFVVLFIGATRGAFAYHRLKAAANQPKMSMGAGAGS